MSGWAIAALALWIDGAVLLAGVEIWKIEPDRRAPWVWCYLIWPLIPFLWLFRSPKGWGK